MIISVIMTGAAIWILRTLYLQKQATQAAMFSDISGRISSLLGETPGEGVGVDVTDQYNWIVRLLNELDALVFLSKNKLLSPKMEQYYRDYVTVWIDELPDKYPQATKEVGAEQPGAYRELKDYYKSIKFTDAPMFKEK